MAARALIIAIEDYPKANAAMMEKKLPGVIDSANKFREWLEQKWQKENTPGNQLIFCSEPKQADGRGATWQDIVDALETLKTDGQGMTNELFVYFSGHGFRFEDAPGTQTDVLVASDFVSNGNLCLKLDEVVGWLRSHLGTGHHYYFVDACRNVLNRNQMRVGDSLVWNPNVSGEATCYVLQSTETGAPALVAGPFAQALLGGLVGESKAKIWADDLSQGMMVRYDSLRTHLKKKLATDQPITSKVEGEDGESDAIFAVLQPPEPSLLNVEVHDLEPGTSATLTLTRLRTQTKRTEEINGSAVLRCAPDNYLVEASAPHVDLEPIGGQRVDLFENEQKIVYQAPQAGLETHFPPVTPEESESLVELHVPDGATIEVRGIDNEAVVSSGATESVTLPHGRYEATLRSLSGVTLRRDTVDLSSTNPDGFERILWRNSAPHEEIARHLPNYGISSPWFSESLGGGVEDPDLNLWLALLGGGRIIGSKGDYSKIANFKLHDFGDLPPNSSGIYLLAGFPDPVHRLRVATGDPHAVDWQLAAPAEEMPSIHEIYLEMAAAPGFLSLRVDELEPMTLATCSLPNRVTLVIVTLNENGNPIITQYILPVGHLFSHLDPAIESNLQGRNHLQDLKFLAQASRAFRQRRNLENEFDGSQLQELLCAKWLDPVGAAMAAYECARRGQKDRLNVVAQNLQAHFPGFPDGPAIAALAGQQAIPNGIPLFLDGWLTIRTLDRSPYPPGDSLSYSSALTTWLGTVPD